MRSHAALHYECTRYHHYHRQHSTIAQYTRYTRRICANRYLRRNGNATADKTLQAYINRSSIQHCAPRFVRCCTVLYWHHPTPECSNSLSFHSVIVLLPPRLLRSALAAGRLVARCCWPPSSIMAIASCNQTQCAVA